ncbi:ATP synthase F1 subunit gamma [Paludicola sp. MB14-C6]|uniref:ATP synthase F1 subunit gamma n=1 Tax=Paludihabitans sp. MB14-C6 TaxID=3070656 RepID=UPI0027DB5BB9|nr:ATP synthase F1 subunit gamma [Paludicola sp. MB14-C6]WMJ21822.1 ATP synthase F1 subunit gamma [Paludicola sp. MB14-C6]
MAGGTMKDIKRRIKSIESTAQITNAMELVASSKLRRAKERALNAAPYFETLYQTISDISNMNTDLSSIYTKPRTIKSTLLIVIAGDRGLAGGYNANILKLANTQIEACKEKGIVPKVLAIGKKAVEYYEKRDLLHVGFSNIAEDLDQTKVLQISQIAVDLFKSGEVDEIYIYYTQFISALSQEPYALKVLPISDIKNGTDTKQVRQLCIYEPSPEEVFNTIVPDYIGGMLYGAVVESFASEQGARRTAMESATDNAKEMIDTLSLSYNRARQAAITQELTEIISGAGAL